MRKLTKPKKLLVYEAIRDELLKITPEMSPKRRGFCNILDTLKIRWGIKSLTELYAEKPKISWIPNSLYWFHPEDYLVRKAIIESVIAEMQLSFLEKLQYYWYKKMGGWKKIW